MNIGSCWLKEKNGKKYFSCQISIPFLGDMNFAIFKNEKKEKENQPDYQIVWSAPRKQQDTTAPASTDNAPPPSDEDIPF
jgi:uncharacterized protein (DUF736 family)